MAVAHEQTRHLSVSRMVDGVQVAAFSKDGDNAETGSTVRRVVTSGKLLPHSRLTITVDESVGTLHLLTEESSIIAVVTALSYPRRLAFALLDSVITLIQEKVKPSALALAPEGGLDEQLRPFLKEALNDSDLWSWLKLCLQYDDVKGRDKVAAVEMEVEEVKHVMQGNIQRVLERSPSTAHISNATDELAAHARQYQRRSEEIQRVIEWRNVKVKVVILLVLIVVLTYILMVVFVGF
eukprot:SM000219S06700  [mRNA]  locus=s219:92849:94862:- [translate_table: standard]